MTNEHKIISGQIHVVELPVTETHSHGSGDVSAIKTVLLELTTDSGITGWGEASPWPVFTGTAQANVAALQHYMLPRVMGRSPFDAGALMEQADRIIVGHPEAKAALETALLDISGRALGLPVHRLLGGARRDRVPLSFSIANPDFQQDLAKLERLYEDGLRIFKLKTGFDSHRFDLMRLETLREKYQDTLDLRIDYNQGMASHEALPRLRDMEGFGLTFIEQPVPRDDLDTMAHLTHALTTPLMADESVFNPREALTGVGKRVADIFSLKIMKSGGLRRALDVAAIARAAGIGVYGGCMFETGVAHAAGTHLVAAVADLSLGCEFYMANYYLKDDILSEPFPVRDGFVHVPMAPGLGVEVDRERVKHHALQSLAV